MIQVAPTLHQDQGQAWIDFCDALKAAGQIALRPDAPATELDRAEAWRCLSRYTRLGLQMMLEFGDPDFPQFYAASDDTIKVFLPNPDNRYANATIAGDREYRISGRRGEAPYLSFGTKANRYAVDGTMASTGELEASQMHFEADGRFEIIASRHPQPGNWLPLADDSSMLIVRETFFDRSREAPGSFHIERIGAPGAPRPLDAAALAAGLQRAAGFVQGTFKLVADWTAMVAAHPNQLAAAPYAEAAMRVGGDPEDLLLPRLLALEPGRGPGDRDRGAGLRLLELPAGQLVAGIPGRLAPPGGDQSPRGASQRRR